MKKIGLFGGTFDPPHIGHLQIAKTVLKEFDLNEIWFIPTYEPPHKQKADASPEQRLKMLQLLLNDDDRFSISTIEYDLKGRSYTIDTVKLLKRQFPNVEFYFIIGGDMIDYLPKWYKIDELKRLVQFVGVKREGYEVIDSPEVKMVDMELIPVSSTEIRKQLKNKQTPYGLPDEILHFIRENRLYEN
ncbi:nicotinate-nucleotide adenylyltransferase [Bacillaceae bacterium W0354]